MKNKTVIYLDALIKTNMKITKEVNVVLGLQLSDAEETCKKYRYDMAAYELACGATYFHKYKGVECLVSRENCLECNEYEPKEGVK